MRFSLVCAPLLGSILATAAAARDSGVFSYAASPPSAWAPVELSSTIEFSGSLASSTAAFVLQKDYNHPEKGDNFVVGVRGGGNKGGWVEAVEGRGGARRKIDLAAVGSDDDTTYYSLALIPPHSSDKTYLTISAVLPHASRPEPPSMPQTVESIYMLFEGDLLAPLAGLSPEQKRKLKDMKVRVKTPTPRIVNVHSPDGFVVHQQQGSPTVTFTLQGDAAELGPQVARVHYQQPQAVASIRKLDRIVELSHWGDNLAVQDNIDLFNSGPTLMGQFARIDYQKALMHRRQGTTAVASLSLSLPPSTRNPYFYDVVGNVSTSRFRPGGGASSNPHKAVLPSQQKKKASRTPAVLELQPRYPLMGGWNYSFTVGFDLPLGEYVKMRQGSKKGQYVAAVPFLTPVEGVAVDEVRVEVRLPEGARDIRVRQPFPLTTLSYPVFTPRLFGKHHTVAEGGAVAWTYLDSTGRPTVVMTKEACTDRHGEDVLIEYTLPVDVDLLQKPLACAAVLFSLFAVIIFAKRLSWNIVAPKAVAASAPASEKGKERL
ncbi:dolichyl-diphosphooligosaccharide--protein glycotransferase subunit OST1 [Rhodotorula paludigena]|uniref:dolichyl-diphosphooligosaccharide--protein glycotransferase subunit OST1 n=1 Tax=Rhodotorula paludigena TaxID=86838 RepID=UPI003174ECF7